MPHPSSEHIRRRMQNQRRRDTKPEMALRRELHRRGLRFFVDRRVLPDVRRRHDIVFPRLRLVVEVRGCWWHACPVHTTGAKANSDWWRSKFEQNVARDRDTEQRLAADGWYLVVVWEHEEADHAADRVQHVAEGIRLRLRA